MLNFIFGVLVMSVFAMFAVESENKEKTITACLFAGPAGWSLLLATLIYEFVIRSWKYRGCKSLVKNRETGEVFFVPWRYYSKIIDCKTYWIVYNTEKMLEACKPLIKKSLLGVDGSIDTRYIPKAVWRCSVYPSLSKKETKKLIDALDKDS